jgi:hypothetical protein
MALIPLAGISPPNKALYIKKDIPIQPYETIWLAVCKTESSMRPGAINKKEQAYGIAQIRPNRLKDYNRLTKNNYTLKDCLNPIVSKKVFIYFSSEFAPNEYRLIARDWNKSKTDKYWRKVKKNLEL